ncbi:hypothetical protein O9929_21870 [Vibrio lentus]|nr:hypothetical protein [Vibrio lentus]
MVADFSGGTSVNISVTLLRSSNGSVIGPGRTPGDIIPARHP